MVERLGITGESLWDEPIAEIVVAGAAGLRALISPK